MLHFQLIAERVRAGLRNARAKGKKLGRPRSVVDALWVAALRSQGLGAPPFTYTFKPHVQVTGDLVV